MYPLVAGDTCRRARQGCCARLVRRTADRGLGAAPGQAGRAALEPEVPGPLAMVAVGQRGDR